jgi:signal transduction histidine kinase
LFTEFSTPPWTTEGQARRVGIGLALTRKLLEAQGGSIEVRSTPGQGSVFSIVLPRAALARRA